MDLWWEIVEPHVQRAMEHGATDWDMDQIKSDLDEGTKLLWIAYADQVLGVLITQLVEQGGQLSLVIFAIGGKHLPELFDCFQKPITDYAREMQATRVQAWTRDGVARMLKKRAWQKVTTLMEYPIDGTIQR